MVRFMGSLLSAPTMSVRFRSDGGLPRRRRKQQMRVRSAVLLAALLPLAACGDDERRGKSGSPPASFAVCASCHSLEPGRNAAGPSLHGVVGRKAGSVPGFRYSAAMEAAGFVWDEASLDAYLAAPQRKVPGNRMGFGGMPDPAARAELIAWLATL